MAGDVIVTVTLNAALHVAYTAGDPREGVPCLAARLPGRRPGRDRAPGTALVRPRRAGRRAGRRHVRRADREDLA